MAKNITYKENHRVCGVFEILAHPICIAQIAAVSHRGYKRESEPDCAPNPGARPGQARPDRTSGWPAVKPWAWGDENSVRRAITEFQTRIINSQGMRVLRSRAYPGFGVNIHARGACACVCTRARIIAADEPWRRRGVRVTRIRAGFKRPNVFRELKLLTGVGGCAPPRNCGTLAALMRAFPSLPRIIPAFAARERRSTTCGLPLSAYGRPPRVLMRFVTPTALSWKRSCCGGGKQEQPDFPRREYIARGFHGAGSWNFGVGRGRFLEEDMGLASFMTGMGMQVGYLFRRHGRMLMQRRDLRNILGGSMSEGRGRSAGQSLFYSRS
ncbi:Uncharacterized protein DBV15_04114 [Temnothorax longispinosus]|uniref:Uncharacterized protein n=1 Tax=Temnothorax longispinosus TaxID=300112 RepID=A0A4S2KCB5_9HYME|nr:Uncharacterized protein DBV15_04114 [Temnothorax longispinosus]